MAYWVKGFPYKDSDKKNYNSNPVIHRFETLKEAEFFKGQIAKGEILPWGDGKNRERS